MLKFYIVVFLSCIGTYFTIMIIMVCASVLLTVIIIHFGFNTRPMPRWVEYLILENIGKIFCLSEKDEFYMEHDALHHKKSADDAVNASGKTNGDKNDSMTEHGSNGMVYNPNSIDDSQNRNVSTVFYESATYIPELAKIVQQLEYIRLNTMHQNKLEVISRKWKRVATVIDRTLLYSFIVLAVVTSVVMMTQVHQGGEMDYLKQYSKFIVNSTNNSTHDDL